MAKPSLKRRMQGIMFRMPLMITCREFEEFVHDRFEVVSRYEVADSATWTQPMVSGDRLYVKDVTTLRLFSLQ